MSECDQPVDGRRNLDERATDANVVAIVQVDVERVEERRGVDLDPSAEATSLVNASVVDKWRPPERKTSTAAGSAVRPYTSRFRFIAVDSAATIDMSY